MTTIALPLVVIVLALLVAFLAGAVLVFAYATFLMAAALWNLGEDDDEEGDEPATDPEPLPGPSTFKKIARPPAPTMLPVVPPVVPDPDSRAAPVARSRIVLLDGPLDGLKIVAPAEPVLAMRCFPGTAHPYRRTVSRRRRRLVYVHAPHIALPCNSDPTA